MDVLADPLLELLQRHGTHAQKLSPPAISVKSPLCGTPHLAGRRRSFALHPAGFLNSPSSTGAFTCTSEYLICTNGWPFRETFVW